MDYRNSRRVLITLSLLAGCGSSDSNAPTPPPGPPTMTAEVQAAPSLEFKPGTVTILRGGTVTVAFGSVAHNVFFDNGPAGAPANIAGNNANVSKTLTFPTAGTFVYNCHIHPGMRGTVVVVDQNQ